MTSAPTTQPSRTGLLGAVAAVVVVVVSIVVVVVLVTRNDSAAPLPPLTAIQHRAGVIRVSYPDRSLPDQPSVTTVAGKRVALYFDDVHESGAGPEAVLRVGVGETGPTAVTLTTGESAKVDGVEVTLVTAYDTGDLSKDAADVIVK